MKKGQGTTLIFTMLALVIAVIVLVLLTNVFGFEKAREAMVLSACEKGVGGETQGMCTDYSVCPAQAISKGSSGCPSSLLKGVFKEGDMDNSGDYELCCVVNSCSDVVDIIEDTSYTRKSAVLSKNNDACVGFAKDCSQDEDCCCVLGNAEITS